MLPRLCNSRQGYQGVMKLSLETWIFSHKKNQNFFPNLTRHNTMNKILCELQFFTDEEHLLPFKQSEPLLQPVTLQFSGLRAELLYFSDFVFPMRFWVTEVTRKHFGNTLWQSASAHQQRTISDARLFTLQTCRGLHEMSDCLPYTL